MNGNALIVSGCDGNYFPLIQDLVNSIKKARNGELPAFACFDFGLSRNDREWLKTNGIETVVPDDDLDLHSSVTDLTKWRPFTVRPFIPKYFPNYPGLFTARRERGGERGLNC